MEYKYREFNVGVYTHQKSLSYREKIFYLKNLQEKNPGNPREHQSFNQNIHDHDKSHIKTLSDFDCNICVIQMKRLPIPIATINSESQSYFSNTFFGLPAPALFQKNKQKSFSIEAILETSNQLDKLREIWSKPIFKEKSVALNLEKKSKEDDQQPLDNKYEHTHKKHEHGNKNPKDYYYKYNHKNKHQKDSYIYKPINKNHCQSNGTKTNKIFMYNSFANKCEAIEGPSYEEKLENFRHQLQQLENQMEQEAIQKEFIHQDDDEGIVLYDKINKSIPVNTPNKKLEKIQYPPMIINNPEVIPMEVKREKIPIQDHKEPEAIQSNPMMINNPEEIPRRDTIKKYKQHYKPNYNKHYKEPNVCSNQ